MVETNHPAPNRNEPIKFTARRTQGLTLIISLILIVLMVGGLYVWSRNAGEQFDVHLAAATPTPTPVPGEALRELRATEESDLTTYGWVDRKNGVVHMPIDRAIDLTLERGLSARPTDQQLIQEF